MLYILFSVSAFRAHPFMLEQQHYFSSCMCTCAHTCTQVCSKSQGIFLQVLAERIRNDSARQALSHFSDEEIEAIQPINGIPILVFRLQVWCSSFSSRQLKNCRSTELRNHLDLMGMTNGSVWLEKRRTHAGEEWATTLEM